MSEIYIIDLERINQLTSHPADTTGGYGGGQFVYSISRKIVKELMDVYSEHQKGISSPKGTYESALETLKYNKILITEADIRDRKIDTILPEDKPVKIIKS